VFPETAYHIFGTLCKATSSCSTSWADSTGRSMQLDTVLDRYAARVRSKVLRGSVAVTDVGTQGL
jgi:hypothetical protein